MSLEIEPKSLSFDAYTICSFVPQLASSRAIPLVLIGHTEGEEATFVWLVPDGGIAPHGLTDDPYYAKLLADPRGYFERKLRKYAAETGCVRRGIEALIDYHQEHLHFTDFRHLGGRAFVRPLEVNLVSA